MRLSVEDPKYRTDAEYHRLCHGAVVLLDGVMVTRCLTADEEQGYIERTVIDEQGKLVIEGNEVKTERIEGKVEIITSKRKWKNG